MRLQQNQVWQQGDHYFRIVRLERLAVEYKTVKDLVTHEGPHEISTKKAFCRLLKGATLMPDPAPLAGDSLPPLAAAPEPVPPVPGT